MFENETHRLFFSVAMIGIIALIADTALIRLTGQGIRYIPEFFGVLLAPTFIAVVTRSAVGNYIQAKKETYTQYTEAAQSNVSGATIQPPGVTGAAIVNMPAIPIFSPVKVPVSNPTSNIKEG